MKSIFLCFYSISIVLLISSCTTIKASDAQVEDLNKFGYPIIFNGPICKNGDPYFSIEYKNISNLSINKIIFVLKYLGGTERNYSVSKALKPNQTGKSSWGTVGGEYDGTITRIIVTYENGQTNDLNALNMLANKNYSSGTIRGLEKPNDEIAQFLEDRQIERRTVEAERQTETQERQRIAQEEAESRRLAQEERQREDAMASAQRIAEAEAIYRNAIASRDVDTIMYVLQSNALSPLQSDRRNELRIEGYHEVAKIITRNNNIKLGDFTASWERFFSPRNPPNPNAFDKNVVYYLYSVRPTQLVDGMFVVRLGSYPEDSILLLDIPVQETKQWGVTFSSLFGVLMKYEGLLPMQLPNGRITEIPSFNILYHYHDN